MVTRRHNHISATCAVARKLAGRTWAVLQTGQPYVLRDLDGNPVDWHTATAIATTLAVPTVDRRRARAPPTTAADSRPDPRQLLPTSARTVQPQATADNPPGTGSVNPEHSTTVRKSGQRLAEVVGEQFRGRSRSRCACV